MVVVILSYSRINIHLRSVILKIESRVQQGSLKRLQWKQAGLSF